MTCWRCIRCGLVRPDTCGCGCGGRVEPLDRPMRHHERKEYTFAIWTDGPDSEAARAARGEGHSMPADWHQHLAEVAAEHEGICGSCGGECEPDPVPDPSHTPAVRRVVAWETYSRELDRSSDDAYLNAAHRIVRLAWSQNRRSVGNLPSWQMWLELWSDERTSKVAAWLRHRDEKAGHR